MSLSRGPSQGGVNTRARESVTPLQFAIGLPRDRVELIGELAQLARQTFESVADHLGRSGGVVHMDQRFRTERDLPFFSGVASFIILLLLADAAIFPAPGVRRRARGEVLSVDDRRIRRFFRL